MPTWIQALKIYNDDKMWCIPRKGTPEHAEVKAIMAGGKAPAAAPAPAAVPKAKTPAKVTEPIKEVAKKSKSLAAEINKRKKTEVKEAVIKAAKEAQRVYDANKDKTNYYTGQIGDAGKKAIGKAEQAIRSASLSEGGGTLVSLTEKEYNVLVKKHYPR